MRHLIGLLNLLLIAGSIAIGVRVSMAAVPDLHEPEEPPPRPVLEEGLYSLTPKTFEEQYEVCWELLAVEPPPPTMCERCGKPLPAEGDCRCVSVPEKGPIVIHVRHINGADLAALASVVLEYRGTAPGKTAPPSSPAGYTAQKHLLFVGRARPFRLSCGRIARLVEVVSAGEKVGARFEILDEEASDEAKRKFTVMIPLRPSGRAGGAGR